MGDGNPRSRPPEAGGDAEQRHDKEAGDESDSSSSTKKTCAGNLSNSSSSSDDRGSAEEAQTQPKSTPVALNSAGASQATKQLQNAGGPDLEAFLQSTDLAKFLASQQTGANIFAPAAKTTSKRDINSADLARLLFRAPAPSTDGSTGAQRADEEVSNGVEEQAPPANEKTRGEEDDEGKNPPQPEVQPRHDDRPSPRPVSKTDNSTPTVSSASNESVAAKNNTTKTKKREKKAKTNRPTTTQHSHQQQQQNGEKMQAQTAPKATSATPSTTKDANPWTKAREVLLKQKVEKHESNYEYDDLIKYKKQYEIAQSENYRVIPDEFPRRPITEEELEILFLWRSKVIHLRAPPTFTYETHTLKERLQFEQIQRDLLTYSLHIDIPGRARMPPETVKFHFYERLLAKNQSADGPSDKVIDFMTDVYSFSVSATSRRAIVNFDRPEKRDKWEGTNFSFPFGAVTLRAASYFEREDRKHGIDSDTVKLLFVFFFIGRPDLSLEMVHDMVLAICGGLPVLKIEAVEPTGANTLDPHMWKVTLNSVEAPPGLEHTRALNVTCGKWTFGIGLHQPRLATRHPCSICLDTSHFRNKCPNKATQIEKRAQHTRDIVIPVRAPVDHVPVATDLAGFRAQLAQLRAELEPELAKKEMPPQPAGTVAPEQPEQPKDAPGPSPAKKTASNANKTQASRAQVRIIIGAKAGKNKTAATPSKSRKDNIRPQRPTAGNNAEVLSGKKSNGIKQAVGEKREREDDAANKLKEVSASRQPPTRQARTDSDRVERTKPDAPRTRELIVATHVRPSLSRPRTEQLTMKTFLPQTKDELDAEPSPSVECVGSKPPEFPPIKLPALLDEIRMTEVQTPANGSCWKYALVITQSFKCGPVVTADMPGEAKLAFNMGKSINTKAAKKIKGMIADGTVDLGHLCSSVLGRTVAHDSLKQLQDHFIEAAKQPSDQQISRKYWGGDPELKVFVEWVREPIYVVDVMADGDCFPQWYHLAQVRSKDNVIVERAINSHISEAAFRAHMQVYRRNQVVPLVLLLHHAQVGNVASGHFTAARISNEEYRHWAGTDRLRDNMRLRLDKVLRMLDSIDTDLQHHPLRSQSPPATPGSGSVFTPSAGGSSDGISAGESTPHHHQDRKNSDTSGMEVEQAPAAANVEAHDSEDSNMASPPSFELLQSFPSGDSQMQHTIASILSIEDQPQFDSMELAKLLPLSYPSAQAMPIGKAEDDLIRKLQAEPPYDEETARHVRRVYKANNTAYENWKMRQKKEDPAIHKILASAKGPIHACESLQDNIGALIQLVHAVPYPEVLVATIPASVLVRAGQAAAIIGHAQLLHRVRRQLTEGSQSLCTTWIDALVATQSQPEARWKLAQANERWERLKLAAEHAQVEIPARSRQGIPDHMWTKLLAYVLIVPGCLPWAFVERPVPQRCDALAMWLSMPGNARAAQDTATAIANRQWLAARTLFPSLDYGTTGVSQAPTTRTRFETAEATPRN